MDTTKQRVKEFYDEVGWAQESDGLFQNARFEDLRPVSREYIHRCHLRVNRHIPSSGELLLDAGSGPVQWPEYMTYSAGYRHRVCVDISVTALRAARAKLGTHGFYVVADIASLPFSADVFDGVISMHAIHHLPSSEHGRAYTELGRVLRPGRSAVTINGWYRPMLMRIAEPLISIGRLLSGRERKSRKRDREDEGAQEVTFVQKMTPARLRMELRGILPYEVFPWRSLSPRFMQWFIREELGGRSLLRLVFRLEETFPGFFGLHGQYPMIVIRKPGLWSGGRPVSASGGLFPHRDSKAR
jgi:SAM-dependent methyltransferase